jgi:copper type II ascorbate-dependent monooxygenase-like protein
MEVEAMSKSILRGCAGACLAGLFACGGSGSSPSAGGTTSTQGTSYMIDFGPITVPAGTENTQCIVKRLGNSAAIHVGQIHDVLGTASHHMIVYRVNDTTEQTTPFDCKPFTDTLNPATGNPLVISQKLDDTVQLPQGVGFTLDANQMLRLEMHYINPDAAAVTLHSTSTMLALPDGQYKDEASFLFVGDPSISIPPMSPATLGPVFFPVPNQYANSKFFAITGHEHRMGTNVQVWTATGVDDPAPTAIYQVPGWQWSEPKTVMFDPPFQVPAGGGLRFQCDWFNSSTNTINFGESATNEMCFFWAYYYPSLGASVCLHSDNDAGGSNLCCPGSAKLCSLIAGDSGP